MRYRTNLYASDIGNPTRFSESSYVSTLPYFVLPAEITALSRNPASDSAQLFVFTQSSTTLIQAGIRDRTAWSTTPDFQKEIFPVGCVSQRSVVAHYGFLWWFSQSGLTSINSAAQSHLSSSLPYQDEAMADSKSRLSSDLSGVAGVAFENYLLMSVPYADKFNRHTWCLDHAVQQVGQQEPPTWNSFWTGTRPVQWVTGSFNGAKRVFYVSTDFDGLNRVWEAFIEDRLDNGCPITWWMETRAHWIDFPGKYKEFRYADVFVSELEGTVDIGVFYAGSHAGKYKRILTKRVNAMRGSLSPDRNITMEDDLFATKKQMRALRTMDAKGLNQYETGSSADVEGIWRDYRDFAFQMLIVGSGPGAVLGYNLYAEPPVNDDDAGRVEQDEESDRYVRFDGLATAESNVDVALNTLAADNPVFTSVQTESLTLKGYTEIGTGSGESVISQEDADKIAQAVARGFAREKLELVVPKTVSLGAAANEV